MFHEIIRGLEYLHSIGICHRYIIYILNYLIIFIIFRNLRPENLLLDENNVLKITDFINSNTYKPGALLKTGKIVFIRINNNNIAWGSPSYTSPELIAGKPYNVIIKLLNFNYSHFYWIFGHAGLYCILWSVGACLLKTVIQQNCIRRLLVGNLVFRGKL